MQTRLIGLGLMCLSGLIPSCMDPKPIPCSAGQARLRVGAPCAVAADESSSAQIGISPAFAQAEDATSRPNIVIILIDDAALMDVGAYGGEARTPNIDALAARGAVFTQYRTSALCSPTRAMLLTGLMNHQTGVRSLRL